MSTDLRRVAFILFLLSGLTAGSSWADETCENLLQGARLLIDLNPRMHALPSVEARAERQRRRDRKMLTKPVEKVAAWLEALVKSEQRLLENSESLPHAKAFFYRQYVIKAEDVPESYFLTQARILRNEGYGDVTITPQMRNQIISLLIQDQELSLEPWLNYLLKKDAGGENYPIWMKYWILNGVSKLSIYDPIRRSFGARNRQTVAPFPELNPEALAQVKEMILTRLDKEALSNIEDRDLARLIRSANFGQMYAHEVNKLSQYGNKPFLTNEGEWVRYEKGSDHLALVKSLEGHNTGWCTTGRATARDQLSGGDFHVYYTKDDQGAFTRPRLAIRMLDDHIAEIRGVGPNQEFDPAISQSSVLEEKLKEFGREGNKYLQRLDDIRRLTEIDQKLSQQSSLTVEDLRFLREIDRPIQGFGFARDPRIQQFLHGRDVITDLGLIFDIPPSEIAITPDALKSGDKSVYVGDLNWSLGILPSQVLIGKLIIDKCSDSVVRVPPIKISGSLELTAYNCKLDKLDIQAELSEVVLDRWGSIGKVQLSPSVERLQTSLTHIGDLRGTGHLKHLDIRSLQSAGHLELPSTEENWKLPDLVSVQTLVVAPGVKSLYLPNLQFADSIVLPNDLKILRLPKLTEISAIRSLPSGLSELILGGVTSAKILELPSSLERLWLDRLTDARELPILPATLKSLELDSLVETDGLLLPENLETLWLPKLRSAKKLKKPGRFEQMIYRGPTDFKE